MRLSKQLYQNKLQIQNEWEKLEIYKLLQMAGFVDFPYSGFPQFMPIGQKVINSICNLVRSQAECFGFSEIYLPLIQHTKFIEQSGRLDLFKDEIFFLPPKYDSYMLTPTNEEVFLNMALMGVESYRQFPIRLFQIADKFRNIQRPRGLMRSKQFLMCDMCSIDSTEFSLYDSIDRFEHIVKTVFQELELNIHRIQKADGSYVDYMIISPDGETRIVMSSDGLYKYKSLQEGDSPNIRASSLAMYFLFKIGNQLKKRILNKLGLQDIFMGTYGFGIQRCLHAIVQQHIDSLGINFPKSVRPFYISIIPIDAKDEDQLLEAIKIYEFLMREKASPLLDDRLGLTIKQRASYSDFLGVPIKIFVGKSELEHQTLTVKPRGKSSGEEISKANFLNHFWNYI